MAEEVKEEPKKEEAPKPAADPPAEKPAEAAPAANQPTSASNATPSSSGGGGGKVALIIILVIVVILAVLGVGGYFAWKYFAKGVKNKVSSITSSLTATATKTSSSGLTVTALEEIFKYPNGTVTSTDREKVGDIVSVTSMKTADSFSTVQDYYVALAGKKSYTVTKKSKDGDDQTGYNGWVNVDGTDFKAEIYINQYTGSETTIEVSISGANLAEGTGITASSTVTTSKTATSGDYVISDSATRVLAESDLTSLSDWQLKVARNEIYARHGREFVHKDLQCYFAKKGWYKVDSNFSESSLSTTETKNVATILAYEQKINSSLYQTDSGCDTNS